jgi:uncharacterized protein (DUF1697 family)
MVQQAATMRRYIALLRAINVGGHTVKMDALRTLFEVLGFANVATFIASGNVIFESADPDAPALERRIERHLHGALGYEVATFIRSAADLAAIAQYQPFPAAELAGETTSLYVGFLAAAPGDTAREKLLALRTPTDEFQVHDREIYWLCRTRMSDSPVSGALLEKALRMPATWRNSTTVQKLAAKYAVPPWSATASGL